MCDVGQSANADTRGRAPGQDNWTCTLHHCRVVSQDGRTPKPEPVRPLLGRGLRLLPALGRAVASWHRRSGHLSHPASSTARRHGRGRWRAFPAHRDVLPGRIPHHRRPCGTGRSGRGPAREQSAAACLPYPAAVPPDRRSRLPLGGQTPELVCHYDKLFLGTRNAGHKILHFRIFFPPSHRPDLCLRLPLALVADRRVGRVPGNSAGRGSPHNGEGELHGGRPSMVCLVGGTEPPLVRIQRPHAPPVACRGNGCLGGTRPRPAPGGVRPHCLDLLPLVCLRGPAFSQFPVGCTPARGRPAGCLLRSLVTARALRRLGSAMGRPSSRLVASFSSDVRIRLGQALRLRRHRTQHMARRHRAGLPLFHPANSGLDKLVVRAMPRLVPCSFPHRCLRHRIARAIFYNRSAAPADGRILGLQLAHGSHHGLRPLRLLQPADPCSLRQFGRRRLLALLAAAALRREYRGHSGVARAPSRQTFPLVCHAHSGSHHPATARRPAVCPSARGCTRARSICPTTQYEFVRTLQCDDDRTTGNHDRRQRGRPYLAALPFPLPNGGG